MLREFLVNDDGLETIEYGVLTALIVVGLVVALSALGGSIATAITNVVALI